MTALFQSESATWAELESAGGHGELLHVLKHVDKTMRGHERLSFLQHAHVHATVVVLNYMTLCP